VSARDLDRRLLVLARTRGHTAARDRAIARLSHAGQYGACWLALGAAGAAVAGPGERRAQWLHGARLVAAAYGLNTAVKLAVRRPRPALAGLPALTATPTQLSFPSAHATTGFAAARSYGAVVPAGPLYALATSLAASRLYLGVHYPSDVVAGAALGTVLAGRTTSGPRWR
jgi:membrane-associated phospholipid phosphatase